MSVTTSVSEHRAAAPRLGVLLGVLGIVYGDIGTSPLYAFKAALQLFHDLPITSAEVLGILSLIFWSLVLVVTIKYVTLTMRADNRGEGGILALMALAQRVSVHKHTKTFLGLVGIAGACLFFSDGVITPAISVLSAVEGLEIATPHLQPWVLWITLAILVLLFSFQKRGTSGVGAVFGPIMLIWFAAIAVLGLNGILQHPAVIGAALPTHAISFFAEDPRRGLLVLGAVFLAVTGGEALYADLGHFGHTAIQLAWFTIPLPALMLNYFGQGALLLMNPEAAANPFYLLAPSQMLYFLIPLATVAAVIASQAVISGAFSLTRQAVALGYVPRMDIEHTSSREIGQIYVPLVNKLLAVLTIALVFGFQTSSNLAGAYGVALSTLMALTTVMFYVMSREVWGWSFVKAASVSGAFLIVDLTFLAANALKIWHGGWVPLAIAIALYFLMITWKRGREILAKRMQEKTVPLKLLLADLAAEPPVRVPGTAVFMYGSPDGTPPALVLNLTHNKVLHEKIVFLTVVTEDVPHVADEQRVTVKRSGKGFHTVVARYGFMQDPDITEVLAGCKTNGLNIPLEGTTFFLGRETLIASERPGMAMWRERLFAFMSRNALRATAFFKIPPNQVFEVGAHVEL